MGCSIAYQAEHHNANLYVQMACIVCQQQEVTQNLRGKVLTQVSSFFGKDCFRYLAAIELHAWEHRHQTSLLVFKDL